MLVYLYYALIDFRTFYKTYKLFFSTINYVQFVYLQNIKYILKFRN